MTYIVEVEYPHMGTQQFPCMTLESVANIVMLALEDGFRVSVFARKAVAA